MAFDFQKAQEYELRENIKYVEKHYDELMLAMKVQPSYHHCKEFFNGSESYMDAFFDLVLHEKTTFLEVSPGICGALPFWKSRLAGRLIAIDPLIYDYDEYLQGKGKSWFDGIEKYDELAETFISELADSIDGFIFWRNGINHYAEPWNSIETVSRYAAKGCTLFFWAEIQHKDTPDAGHRNVTSNPQEVEDCILAQGWRLLYHTDNSVFKVPGISYGGVFEMQ